jgi:hypothetical protein
MGVPCSLSEQSLRQRLASDPQAAAAALSLCNKIARAAVARCSVLWFNTHEPDLFSMYERLAFRDLAISSFFIISSPGVSLSESDLTRNFLLSFFPDESTQLRMYHAYWIPIESAREKRTLKICSLCCPVRFCIPFLRLLLRPLPVPCVSFRSFPCIRPPAVAIHLLRVHIRCLSFLKQRVVHIPARVTRRVVPGRRRCRRDFQQARFAG